MEKVFAAGQMHELGGKQVEVKSATPKGSGPQAGRGAGRGAVSAGGAYGGRGYGGGGGGGRGGYYQGQGYGGYGGSAAYRLRALIMLGGPDWLSWYTALAVASVGGGYEPWRCTVSCVQIDGKH